MQRSYDTVVFSGFVGLFNLLLLWPLFFLFHYSKWELFEWPTRHQWTFLLLNGLVGTVLSEVLWLWYVNTDLLLIDSVLPVIKSYVMTYFSLYCFSIAISQSK